MAKKSYIIVGSGFRGFCDAVELLKDPEASVHIIDSAPFFGGISYSGTIKGFAVDKGVHMFDSIPVALADIVNEIMDGKTREIDFVSVSAFNGRPTEGFSLPDLSSLPEETKQQITAELLELAKTQGGNKNPANLAEHFEARYGKTAGQIFCELFKPIYNIDAKEIQPDGISKTSMGRLKHLDDEAMLKLKQDPWLDTVLAARRKAVGKVDDYVSIYPDTGDAMRGWCERTVPWLESKGCTVSLGEKITAISSDSEGVTVTTDKQTLTADYVIWSNDNAAALAPLLGFEADTYQYISTTPMLFATLFTKVENIRDFTYLQNFDPESYAYRTSSAGIYSGQTNADGISFITCECPTQIGSDRWENADAMGEKIWQESIAMGIIAEGAELADQSILRLPVTFKVAKVGYDDAISAFQHEVAKRDERILFRSVKPFFRRDIYLDSLKLHEAIEANSQIAKAPQKLAS